MAHCRKLQNHAEIYRVGTGINRRTMGSGIDRQRPTRVVLGLDGCGGRNVQLPIPSLIDQLCLECVTDEVRVRLHPGLFQDPRSVSADRFHAKREFVGHFLDRLSGSDHS